MRAARGFTLVEVVVGLVLASMLGVLALRLGALALDLERGQGERAGLTAGLRAGLAHLEREIEALGADSIAGTDLDSLPAGLAYRAQRGLRIACQVTPDTLVLAADTALDWTARAPVPGRDSLLLYVAGDSAAPVDAWEPLPIAALSPGGCPSGAPGLRVATSLDSATIARRRIASPTAVRVFETVAVRAYAGAGGWQLGQQSLSAGGTIQPLVAGLVPGGFSVVALDGAGLGIAVDSARTVRLVLRGRTERQLAVGLGARPAGAADSVATEVVLRNRR